MPDPRTIALEKNDRSKFGPEPNDEQINPRFRERDYRAKPAPPRTETRLPFTNLRRD